VLSAEQAGPHHAYEHDLINIDRAGTRGPIGLDQPDHILDLASVPREFEILRLWSLPSVRQPSRGARSHWGSSM